MKIMPHNDQFFFTNDKETDQFFFAEENETGVLLFIHLHLCNDYDLHISNASTYP